MGSILDALLADCPPLLGYEVFDNPKDFELKPVNKYLDYTTPYRKKSLVLSAKSSLRD